MKYQNESITYTERDGIFYPDFTFPNKPTTISANTDKRGLIFLKKHRRDTHITLLVAFKFNARLAEVDRETRIQVQILTTELAKERGISEKLKATNQLRWVQEMSNCKAHTE